MSEYRLLYLIPINIGKWVHSDVVHRGKLPEGWRRFMFQEAAINFSWFPPGSYGKLCAEFKTRHWKMEGEQQGVALAWQKAVRDGGRGRIEIIPGSEIMWTEFRKWEMWESGYFELPEWDEPCLLWIVGYGEPTEEELTRGGLSTPSVAMWTVGIFEKVKWSEKI